MLQIQLQDQSTAFLSLETATFSYTFLSPHSTPMGRHLFFPATLYPIDMSPCQQTCVLANRHVPVPTDLCPCQQTCLHANGLVSLPTDMSLRQQKQTCSTGWLLLNAIRPMLFYNETVMALFPPAWRCYSNHTKTALNRGQH